MRGCFIGSTRAVSLTDDGKHFYELARHVLEAVAGAENAVGKRRTRAFGRLETRLATGNQWHFAGDDREIVVPMQGRYLVDNSEGVLGSLGIGCSTRMKSHGAGFGSSLTISSRRACRFTWCFRRAGWCRQKSAP